jgi:hypothetical protein
MNHLISLGGWNDVIHLSIYHEVQCSHNAPTRGQVLLHLATPLTKYSVGYPTAQVQVSAV